MSGYGVGFPSPRSAVAAPGNGAPLVFSVPTARDDPGTGNVGGAVAVPSTGPGTPPAYGGYRAPPPLAQVQAQDPTPVQQNDPIGMMALGPRGDFVTRTWQPTEAPDDTAVQALMLGPLTSQALQDINARTVGRQAEDDGLLVRQRPKARGDNTHRRKQRAAQENNPDEWFDPHDGGLRCLPDPVPPGSDRARPARWFDPDSPYLQLKPGSQYYHADATELVRIASGGGGGGEPRSSRLEVRVGRLEFSAHPLMGREDSLAAQLEETFRGFKRRETGGLDVLYDTKAKAATARAKALQLEIDNGTELWLGGASPAQRMNALSEESVEASGLAAGTYGPFPNPGTV